LKKLGLIDEIVAEPLGGAHRDPQAALKALGDSVERALKPLTGLSPEALKAKRREKFLAMGKVGL
jgi:acetyl-CoA carboxylase carboxyl transferase subunit alpha